MRLTEKGHALLEESLQTGDLAIDATAGNGHDTLKMAELVSEQGKVIAIDLQQAALEATRSRLENDECARQVELILGDHSAALESLLPKKTRQAGAITFNLGYLPGSDKTVTTREETTIKALDAALSLLKPGAPLLVTAYRGHPGGLAESKAVARWARALNAKDWEVSLDEPATRPGPSLPPVLWVIRRRMSG
jgi:precorrin-6B methylase 2